MVMSKLRQSMLETARFEEGCAEIERWAGWPGDYADRVVAVHDATRELKDRMVAAGFTASRAEDLIRADAPRAIFRQP